MKRTSILQDTKQCYFCGLTTVETHEVFFGKNRAKSIKYGLCVYLCAEHHRGENGVHGKNGHRLDQALKRAAQAEFEAVKGADEFIKLFGRNYL